MRRYVYLFLSLAIFFPLLINATASKKTSQPCKNCHQNIYNLAMSSPSQHSVAIDNCVACHTSKNKNSANYVRGENSRKIISHTYKGEGLFPLGELQNGKKYHIEIVTIDGNGKKSEPEKFLIKPETLNTEAISPLKEIVDVKVVELKQGIFMKASIFWRTKTAATSEIEYGLTKKFEHSLSDNGNLTTEHRVSLTGLQGDNKYYFRAVSKDIYGNEVKSKTHKLDTSKLFSKKESKTARGDDLPALSNARIFKLEKGYVYSSISLNQLSTVRVTISEKSDAVEDRKHSFPSARYSSITVCIECHNQGASHPVNVRAKKKGIIIPDILPTIEKGLMTCVTCHNPHGSKNEYLARFKFNRDLCIKCHVSDGLL